MAIQKVEGWVGGVGRAPGLLQFSKTFFHFFNFDKNRPPNDLKHAGNYVPGLMRIKYACV